MGVFDCVIACVCVNEGVVEPSMGLKNCTTTTWPKKEAAVTVATCAKTEKGGSDKERERKTKSETDSKRQ